MPTGYTHRILKGCTFEEFVWGCARGMGALIHMRDDSEAAPITLPRSSGYHAEHMAKAQAELERLKNADADAVERMAFEAYTTEMREHGEREARRKREAALYRAMLDRVAAWSPPTPEHAEFRGFMLDQIQKSIDFDCDPSPEIAPKRMNPEEWRQEAIKEVLWNVHYHHRHIRDDDARNDSRAAWIRALMESVPLPAKLLPRPAEAGE